MTDTTLQPADDGVDGSNKRTLVLVGGAAGVVILGAAGWFLLHGGNSSDNTAFTPPVHHVTKQATTGKAPTAVTNKTATLPNVSTVRIGRDPFVALYVPQPAAAAGSTSTSATSTTTTPTAAPSSGSPTTDTANNLPYALTLVSIMSDPGGAKYFTFKVDKATKTVLPAQRFGKYGELVVLTYVKNSKGAVTGAVLQVGDDNPVTIAVGTKISVQ
ncbi:MAG: hypothetical protein QOD70_976 [Frankiales bacterium]|jgi:hypothetical protein|nr:hypothetical protein [Frankiales bacterium]